MWLHKVMWYALQSWNSLSTIWDQKVDQNGKIHKHTMYHLFKNPLKVNFLYNKYNSEGGCRRITKFYLLLLWMCWQQSIIEQEKQWGTMFRYANYWPQKNIQIISYYFLKQIVTGYLAKSNRQQRIINKNTSRQTIWNICGLQFSYHCNCFYFLNKESGMVRVKEIILNLLPASTFFLYIQWLFVMVFSPFISKSSFILPYKLTMLLLESSLIPRPNRMRNLH